MELVKEKYKQTEFGWIPEDWEVIRIGDCFDFKNGLNKEKKYFGQGTPIVNYMDVYKNRGITSKDLNGLVTLSAQERKNYKVKQGDVFFTRTSETVDEIGLTTVVLDETVDTVFSGFVLRGRPKNDWIELNFKKYCFSNINVRRQTIMSASYTTRALTNGRALSKVSLLLPKLNEQTAISDALSDADALIKNLEKFIEKKRMIKQGVMQELLKPKEGWMIKKLKEACEIRKGQLITQEASLPGDIPVIAGGKKASYYTNRANRQGKTITISASGANAGYVAFHSYPIFASDCSTIEEGAEYSLEFIYYNLQLLQQKIYKAQTGGAQPHIHPSDLYPFEIPFPELDIQKKTAEALMDMDFEILTLEQKLSKYKLLKQGMMQQLLTGKIRLV